MKRKTILITIIFIVVLSIFKVNSFASEVNTSEFLNNLNKAVEEKHTQKSSDAIFKGADTFITDNTNVIDQSKFKEGIDVLYNILLGIGAAIALIIGICLGIKFMMSTVEEKAQIKESLVAFFIGCIVVFGAFGIWKIVIEMID